MTNATKTLTNKSGKLTRSELTAAVTAYARKNGYYVRTVRDVTALRYAAIDTFKERRNG